MAVALTTVFNAASLLVLPMIHLVCPAGKATSVACDCAILSGCPILT